MQNRKNGREKLLGGARSSSMEPAFASRTGSPEQGGSKGEPDGHRQRVRTVASLRAGAPSWRHFQAPQERPE